LSYHRRSAWRSKGQRSRSHGYVIRHGRMAAAVSVLLLACNCTSYDCLGFWLFYYRSAYVCVICSREEKLKEGLLATVSVPLKMAAKANALWPTLRELASIANIACKSDLQVSACVCVCEYKTKHYIRMSTFRLSRKVVSSEEWLQIVQVTNQSQPITLWLSGFCPGKPG